MQLLRALRGFARDSVHAKTRNYDGCSHSHWFRLNRWPRRPPSAIGKCITGQFWILCCRAYRYR